MKKSLGQPASQVNLTSHPCKGSFDEFKVSGQWYYRGFITLRIINEVSDSWAFFSYTTRPRRSSMPTCRGC